MINAEDPRAHEQYNGIEIQLNWVKIGHTSTRQAYQSLNDVHKGQGPKKYWAKLKTFPKTQNSHVSTYEILQGSTLFPGIS
jgi:hypothetical protein